VPAEIEGEQVGIRLRGRGRAVPGATVHVGGEFVAKKDHALSGDTPIGEEEHAPAGWWPSKDRNRTTGPSIRSKSSGPQARGGGVSFMMLSMIRT